MVAGSVLAVIALVGALVAVTTSDPGIVGAQQRTGASGSESPLAGASASPLPSASPTPSPSPSLSPSPSPESAPAPASANDPPTKPSRAPQAPIEQEPAPPPPAPEPLPDEVDCPYYEGENAPQAEVGAALETAAAQAFWTVSQVNLPPRLIKSVAEQESGWQSAIMACDGGIGTMQVMPGTADWMNQRFGTAHDVHTLSGNTMLGSAFLQWLTKYFGDVYFGGDYELHPADCQQLPDVPDHREWCLLNAVISGYNYGHGAVDNEADDGDETYYPNHPYVENVRALMSRF